MHLTHPPCFLRWVNFLGDVFMKKGMIFIDGSNLFFDYKNHTGGKKLDVEKYINSIKEKFKNLDILRTYYFATETDTNKGFLQQINKLPYCQVIKGHLQNKTVNIYETHNLECDACKKKITGKITTQVDKGTDVNIAVEMLKHAYINTYDTAILVSRDADFSSVVRIIKNLGKNVELILFEDSKNNAWELTDCVDNVVLISKSEYSLIEKETEDKDTV